MGGTHDLRSLAAMAFAYLFFNFFCNCAVLVFGYSMHFADSIRLCLWRLSEIFSLYICIVF